MAPIVPVSSLLSAKRPIIASGIDDLSDHRKFHRERRTIARRAVHMNLARMLLNDAVRYRQPEPRAAAVPGLGFVLGGEERIIDAVNVLLRDAAASVGHRDLHVVPVAGRDR